MKFNKRTWLLTAIISVVLLSLAFPGVAPDLRFGPDFRISSKVIHPGVKGFNPDQFDVADYDRYDDLVYVLSRILPQGTHRSSIEDFITHHLHPLRPYYEKPADATDSRFGNISYYLTFDFTRFYQGSCFLSRGGNEERLTFYFSHDDRLQNFQIINGCGAFIGYKHKEKNHE